VTHPYLSITDADREAMLETIGVGSVEELFRLRPSVSTGSSISIRR